MKSFVVVMQMALNKGVSHITGYTSYHGHMLALEMNHPGVMAELTDAHAAIQGKGGSMTHVQSRRRILIFVAHGIVGAQYFGSDTVLLRHRYRAVTILSSGLFRRRLRVETGPVYRAS